MATEAYLFTDVAREAAKTAASGPASGEGWHTGSRAGFRNLLTYDMGGTSSDVAILDAEPAVSNEIEIEYAMPIHVPMVMCGQLAQAVDR